MNTIDVAYGKGSIPLRADPSVAEWEVIRPGFEPAHPNPVEGFRQASAQPLGADPLSEVAGLGDRVVIVTSDGTRPVPNRQLIPWIIESLGVPDDRLTVLIGTGSHRPNTPAEIDSMFGDLARRVKIVNHDAFGEEQNQKMGTTASGTDVYLDSAYVEADRRIVVGFIEPHFFAGFSGGAKGIAPGVAGIDTILRFHRADLIGHPNSTWGVIDGNPIQEEIAQAVAMLPPDFMVNVTLNAEKAISGFYLGDYVEAHREGCDAVKAASMQPVARAFPVVVTSNSGFPLDQNLYQTVKGISAAARIVGDGGTIVVASECSDGIPDHGNFAQIMRDSASPADVIGSIQALERPILDQWQAQILAGILERSAIKVRSDLPREDVEMCKMDVIEDVDSAVAEGLEGTDDRRVAVLPDGPLTIPYLQDA